MTNTMNLQDFINEQVTTRRSRTSNYTEYGSKKKLIEAQVLSEEHAELISLIKNTFSFNLHQGHRYLIITLYTKADKYSFLIVDLSNNSVISAPSIKLAKKLVDELVTENDKLPKLEAIEEVKLEVVTGEHEEVKEEVKEETVKPKRSKKSKEVDDAKEGL